jgi:hypothetical protein
VAATLLPLFPHPTRVCRLPRAARRPQQERQRPLLPRVAAGLLPLWVVRPRLEQWLL